MLGQLKNGCFQVKGQSWFDSLSHITVLPKKGITIKKGGVQFSDISIYPQPSCAPESSNQQTPAPLHPPWLHKPINTCDLWPNRLSPLHASASSYRLIERLLLNPPGHGAPWVITIHSMVWPTSCHSPSTHLSPYTTKEVPPASSKKITVYCGVLTVFKSVYVTLQQGNIWIF